MWTGEQFGGVDLFSLDIPAHGSRLIAINIKNSISLYDCNIRINKAFISGNALCLEADYKEAKAEFTFNNKPKKVLFNDAEISWNACGKKVILSIPDAGALRFEF